MFGEMALIVRAEGLASAMAETNGLLPAINRKAFPGMAKTILKLA